MQDVTKAELQNQVFHIQTVKISSKEEQWPLLIQIWFNPPLSTGLSILEQKQLDFVTKFHY